MMIPKYEGFDTARERGQTYQILITTIENQTTMEGLEFWRNDIDSYIEKIRFEIKEGKDIHNFDFEELYIKPLIDAFITQTTLITMIKEFGHAS